MTSKTESYKVTKVRIAAPYSITHHFKAGREFDGCSIPNMMHARFPYRDKLQWADLQKKGRLGITSKEVDLDYKLGSQDEVFHFNPRVVEPAVPDEVKIIQEHDDYLIVFKPAPMPMHPGGRYNKNSLTKILAADGWHGLKIVHRLDAVTSGLVLFARSKVFAKKITQAFENGEVQKKYVAHVSGVPSEKKHTIQSDIRRKSGFVFESGKELSNAKKAISKFNLLHKNESSSILECEPITGRTHQLRLHLKDWGYPIIDDPIYGINGDESSIITQNVGISLWNIHLAIQDLGIEASIDIPEEWFIRR